MKYLVIYYEEEVGYFFDEEVRYFDNENAANEYCKKLNKVIANANDCNIEDLGDYYVVEEIYKGE